MEGQFLTLHFRRIDKRAMKVGSDLESCIVQESRVDRATHYSSTGHAHQLLFFSWRRKRGASPDIEYRPPQQPRHWTT
jgi:hypothetical protein